MICNKCAAQIPQGINFCPHCGTAVTDFPLQLPKEPDATMQAVQTPRQRRRERRRERRRSARGFWYAPLVNFIILALTAVGWIYIPREVSVYVTDAAFGHTISRALDSLRYTSARDVLENFQSEFLALLLCVILIVLSIMSLFAIYHLIKRFIIVSRHKKEWKKEKNALLHDKSKRENF